jgi:hypothetical protein
MVKVRSMLLGIYFSEFFEADGIFLLRYCLDELHFIRETEGMADLIR